MVAWIQLLVCWNWFHGCLVKVPRGLDSLLSSLVKVYGCLDSLPACLHFVP